MILDLDNTIKELIETFAPANSELAGATVSFDLPDAGWRAQLDALTVNCYLYDIRQNMAAATNEPILVQSADQKKRARVRPPARIDCAYCITAWSPALTGAVFEEHRLLSQLLQLFLRFPKIPDEVLQGALVEQMAPFPGIVASQEGVRNLPEFWSALDQKLKPSLNYVITLGMLPDAVPTDAEMVEKPTAITVGVDHR
ncbi:DUF4255 domain-containing protein [Nannocystis punicea]|uniref:DUF4255 domain-containing protein n=1 Tax=Nannocystis punicea TaxID=2995304 RepID=A0ABY7GVN3_9BACT|nr:DUF4255 domain-containing protein [Nannocystis poenicansa]WAS91034.1 DUF4255 domain-containing protein [Nannocystis poenicansa]